MGAPDANISRDIFDERKRYRRAVAQQGVPLVDADENDSSQSLATYIQRTFQQGFGDGWINDGFKVVEADSSGHRSNDPADNFIVVGSSTNAHAGEDIDDPYLTGAFVLEGLRAVLFGDVEYKPDDSFPDPPGNPDPLSARSVFPRITDVSEGGGNTTITDSAQQYKVNELVGRNIHVLGSGLAPQAITANTATEITIAGLHASAFNVYDRYVVTLTAPTIADPGTREDGVYLNMYLDQINAAEDPSLYHAIGTAVEAKIREQVIQEIFVREDIGTHGDWINELDDVDGQYRYTDYDGNLHYVVKVASIIRAGAGHVQNANIRNSMITNIQGEFALGLTQSPFNLMGSAEYADDSVSVDNIPVHSVNGWPEVPEGYPTNAIYIAREEDDQSNPAGFYGNTAGSWSYLYNVEVEDALDVGYDNSTSGLAATNVQAALDEVDGDLDSLTSSYSAHDHSAADPTQVAHADTTGRTTDDHHAQSHDAASHSDISSSGASIDAAVSASHAQSHTVASHSDTTATGAELDTLTGAGNADTLHTHAHSATTGRTANDHHNRDHAIDNVSDHNAPSGYSANNDKYRMGFRFDANGLPEPGPMLWRGITWGGGSLAFGTGSWTTPANFQIRLENGVSYAFEAVFLLDYVGSGLGTRNIRLRFQTPTISTGEVVFIEPDQTARGCFRGTVPSVRTWTYSVNAYCAQDTVSVTNELIATPSGTGLVPLVLHGFIEPGAQGWFYPQFREGGADGDYSLLNNSWMRISARATEALSAVEA